MAIRLLILDLDGTIVDTLDSIREAVNHTLVSYGFPKRSREEIRVAIGNGAKELIRRSLPREHQRDDALVLRVFADYDKQYGYTYDHVDGCYAGMAESMRALSERGYTLAVLSNKQDAYVKKIVSLLFPDGLVALAQGQTELPKKPDPTVPLMICRELGFLPEQTAFVGDSDVDIFTGKNAGMMTVGCSWGFRPEEELIEAGADRILHSGWELADLFA